MHSNRAPWFTGFSETNCGFFSYERSLFQNIWTWKCETGYEVSSGLHFTKERAWDAGLCTCSGSESPWRNPERTKPKSFIMTSKLVCPDFAPQGDPIFVFWGCWRCNTFEQRVQNKSYQCWCWHNVPKFERDPCRTVSRSNLLVGTLVVCLRFSLFHKVVNEQFSVCFIACISLWCILRDGNSEFHVPTFSSALLDNAAYPPR